MWAYWAAWALAGLSLIAWFRYVGSHDDISAMYWLTFVAVVLTIFVSRGWLVAPH